MKILCVADNESRELWDHWKSAGSRITEGVELILSAGDIRPEYLEFLVTMLNVPCMYVRGNHDGMYDERPPQGCVCIEDRVVSLYDGSGTRCIRVAGLGGSMRYHDGPDMYTEREMSRRVRKLSRRLLLRRAAGGLSGSRRTSDGCEEISILLTHAPSLGHGDLEDLPHRGFACFNDLMDRWQPDYHLYGHVHMEYGNFTREHTHPAVTRLINVSGMYILEV